MKHNKVIFLDFDGVVNTPLWEVKNNEYICRYGYPNDGKVNDWQAVQWVSEFCEKYEYSIVISSTWRIAWKYTPEHAIACLKNGGLREGIEVLGCTPYLENKHRGDEIEAYLNEHPEITHFLIFDDDTDMGKYMDYLVQCDSANGFKENEYNAAVTLHKAFNTGE